MSHVVGVNCEFKDLDVLERACAKKKATLVRDQKTHAFYGGATERCDHAIKVPGTRYEVGLRRKAQADEAYEPRYDKFDSTVERVLGTDLIGLQNEYLAVAAEDHADRLGYRVEREEVGQEIRLHVIR